MALVLTIDRTLNGIWRVRRPRPLAQRVLIYWAPSRWALAAGGQPGGHLVRAVGLARAGGRPCRAPALRAQTCWSSCCWPAAWPALYRYVPNTPVRRSHAWPAGVRRRWHRGRQAPAGLVPGRGADLFDGVRRLRHRADPAGVDLRRLGGRAAGRGDRGLPAQPAGRRGAPRQRARLAVPAGAARCCSSCTQVRSDSGAGAVALDWVGQLNEATSWLADPDATAWSDALQLEPGAARRWCSSTGSARLNEVDDQAHALRAAGRPATQSTALEPLLRHLLLIRVDGEPGA
jgi:hypothetical protein